MTLNLDGVERKKHKRKLISERFVKYINKRGVKVSYMPTRCWEWSGYVKEGRYGMFAIASRPYGAHRVSWIFANRKRIPKGMCILHKCDRPSCVRPSHLFLGTQKENMQDAVSKRRLASGKVSARANKLTSDEVEEIRECYAQGDTSQAAIAREYGVSRQNVGYIVNFKSRKQG